MSLKSKTDEKTACLVWLFKVQYKCINELVKTSSTLTSTNVLLLHLCISMNNPIRHIIPIDVNLYFSFYIYLFLSLVMQDRAVETRQDIT